MVESGNNLLESTLSVSREVDFEGISTDVLSII